MTVEPADELHELLYALTHDLAAPLRVIDGFSEAMLDEALPPDALEYLTTIRGSVAHMQRMFDGILQLHRISQAPLRRVEVDVTALAESIASELCAAETARDVRFEIEPNLVANADAALFRIALDHLLRNAWKFTSKRQDAVIAVGSSEEQPLRGTPRNPEELRGTTLHVRDNGAGFDPATAGRMFTPFQRFHSASDYDGLGIGLAVVRRVVYRHGGQVRATGALQQGTTISVELP